MIKNNVYIKKYKKYKRKRAYRKKKYGSSTTTKISNGMRIMNPLKPKIMTFKRSTTSLSIGQPTSLGNVTGTIVFKLTDMPQSSEITSLFSKFRITNVKVTYRLQDAPTDGSYFPTIYSWKNYNVAQTVPIDVFKMQQIPNIHVLQCGEDNRVLTHNLKPFLITSIFNGGYTQAHSQWIDCNYASVAQYYGLCYFIENLVGSNDQSVRLTYDLEYTIQCLTQF